MAYGDYKRETRYDPRHRVSFQQFNPNGSLFSETFTSAYAGGLQSVIGDKLPNYKTLISSGGNATTTLNATRYTSKLVSDTVVTLSTTGRTCKATNLFSFGLPNLDSSPISLSAPAVANVKADALNKLGNYIRERQNPFAAQQFIGELPETLKLLGSPLKSSVAKLLSYQKVVKKGRTAKDFADAWLELQFGIIPLMNDINEIIDIYNGDLNEKEKLRFYASATGVASATNVHNNGGSTMITNAVYTRKTEYIVRCGIIFDRLDKHDDLIETLKNATTDFSSLASTAWELTPYSFLVDYFVNVGSIISSSTIAGIQTNYIVGTEIRTDSWSEQSYRDSALSKTTYPNHKHLSGSVGTFTSTKRTVKRSGLQSIVPPLVFKIPNSDTKLANLAALAISAFSKA